MHKDADAALQAADELRERLEDYPILDEEDFSNREYEQACESWKWMSLGDRLDAIKRYGNRQPLAFLAARFDDFSRVMNVADDSGSLLQYLTQ